MKHRVACRRCGTHRDLNVVQICDCGSDEVKTVTPTTGDLAAVKEDVIRAAELLDVALLQGAVVSRSHELARGLAAACRELALTRAGILCR